MASEVATMQPAITVKSSRRASLAIASASVRPPALSSLILTASYLPASAGSEARSRALDGREFLIGILRQRLLDQHHSGSGTGGEMRGEIASGPAFVGVDDQRR